MINIAQLWETCLQFEYDRAQLVASLSGWLTKHSSRCILDAACGTGFPALDLLKQGFQVTCTDGSPDMLAHFRQNALRADIAVEPHCIEWKDLRKYFTASFDTVICRGNSLIYAGTWDDESLPDPSVIEAALDSFYQCLRIGGVLYVDTTPKEEIDNPHQQSRVHPIQVFDGHTVRLSERVDTDTLRKVRTWNSELLIDGKSYHFCRRSYYLPHDELINMLRRVGFEGITKYNMPGEPYDVFIAFRRRCPLLMKGRI
jgi:SAM-dependent methyltransferase